jgi:hypothetical protein
MYSVLKDSDDGVWSYLKCRILPTFSVLKPHSVFRCNVERGEPTLMSPLERPGLTLVLFEALTPFHVKTEADSVSCNIVGFKPDTVISVQHRIKDLPSMLFAYSARPNVT